MIDGRIVYIGATRIGKMNLIALLEHNFPIVGIITVGEEIVRKTHISGYASYDQVATRYDIPLYRVQSYNFRTPEDINYVKELQPDLIIGYAWNRLLPKELLNIPRIGTLGSHAGHPPEGRGRAPIPWNIIKGFKDCYLYIFFMDENADSGDIIDIMRMEITPYDNALTVYDKFIICVNQLMIKNIPTIFEKWSKNEPIKTIPQDHSKAIYYAKRSPEDGLIDFSKDAESLYNWIRGQSHPYPGAFTFIRDNIRNNMVKVYIWDAMPFDKYIPFGDHKNGEVIDVLLSGILVQTGLYPMLIKKVGYDSESEGFNFTKLVVDLGLKKADLFQ